jgi:SAM-dependent methyltransferase
VLSEETQQILTAALETMEGREPLPFAPGHSERAVETPWVASFVAKLGAGARLLDIGFTMASLDYLGLLLELRRSRKVIVEAVDIVRPERVVGRYPEAWLQEVLAVPITIGDLLTLSLPEARYELCTCISTIEHIGFDAATHADPLSAFQRSKTADGVALHRDADVNRRVLAQLAGALKPGGILLVTVPMGRGGATLLRDSLGFYCAQWEYQAESWREIVEASEFAVVDERFARLDSDGRWRTVAGPSDLVAQTSELKPHASGCALVALRRR